MYLTEVAVTVFAMPFDRPVDEKRFAATNNFVDTHVFAKLKELRIEPTSRIASLRVIVTGSSNHKSMAITS